MHQPWLHQADRQIQVDDQGSNPLGIPEPIRAWFRFLVALGSPGARWALLIVQACRRKWMVSAVVVNRFSQINKDAEELADSVDGGPVEQIQIFSGQALGRNGDNENSRVSH